MGNEVGNNKFTWVIKNFTSLQSKHIFSDEFVIGGCKWRLKAYPNGDTIANHLSLSLVVADATNLHSGWKRHANFTLTVVNQFSEELSEVEELEVWSHQVGSEWSVEDMINLGKLKSDNGGFMVNGEVKIVAEVHVRQVIGELDVPDATEEATQPREKIIMNGDGPAGVVISDLPKQTPADWVNINGFQVLPSQAESVKRIFTWVIKDLSLLKTEYIYSETTMGNEADNKLSWVTIQNSKCITSDYFVTGGVKWFLGLAPRADYLCLFLEVGYNEACLWRVHAKYRLTVVNQLSEKLSLVQEAQCWFDFKTSLMNYPELIPFSKLSDEDGGFLVNNQVKIVVEIDVLEIIDMLDVPKESKGETQPQKKRKLEETSSVDVSGFHVLPSQVEFVNRVFKKYPDIALQLRAKNKTYEDIMLVCLPRLNRDIVQVT